MTRYTVAWHEDARTQLANLWIESLDRGALAQAADTIDRVLAMDADEKGLAIGGTLRMLAVPPIKILFAVSPLDRMVHVLAVTRS